jgi:hypothetical protein
MNQTKTPANPMLQLLSNSDVNIMESKNELTTLWRLILWRLDIKQVQWTRHLFIWAEKGALKPNKKRYNKGNATRELASEKISWAVFLKGLAILDFVKVEITVKAYRRNQSTPEVFDYVIEDVDDSQDD